MISGQDDSELSIFGRITQFSPTSRTGQIMASLTNHRGLSVLSAPADGAGGEAIRADEIAFGGLRIVIVHALRSPNPIAAELKS